MFLLLASLVCSDCHSALTELYSGTPMARSSGIVSPAAEQPGKVGARYHITPAMKLIWGGGQVDLTFFIGSRRMGRSYAYSMDDHLYQAPVGYYANRSRWDMAPGYENDSEPDLNRPITKECLFCHATSATSVKGTLNRYSNIGHGIQCQRCHGESDDHRQLVNPSKLPPRLRDSVCEQCHLSGAARILKAGKKLEEFRPGQDLADYLEVFVAPAASGKAAVKVNSHAEALSMSRCRQQSARFWCGTCHNPHQPTASYQAVCRQCHQTPHNSGDCIVCHMPKAKAQDGGHTVFTDHRIAIKPGQGVFGSYFGHKPSARDLGLAYFQMGMDRHDSSYFEKAWEQLRPAAAGRPSDPALYATIAKLLEADGHKQQAIAYYRLSLSQNEENPEVLDNLARLLGNSAEARRMKQRSLAILPRPFPLARSAKQ